MMLPRGGICGWRWQVSAACGYWLIFNPGRGLMRAGGFFESRGVGEEEVGLAGGHQGCGSCRLGTRSQDLFQSWW